MSGAATRLLPLAASALLVLAAAPAEAQRQSPAEAAFREGRALMASGDIAHACTKFAESQRLEPAAGTLLNLAECLDKRGLSASAAATYEDAAQAAHQRGRADWEKLARDRAAALEKIVPRVTLVVSAEHAAAHIALSEGGAALEADKPLTIDPGSHTIQAAIPDRAPWTATFEVKNGDVLRVDVSHAAPEAGAASASSPVVTESGSDVRTLGLAAAGVGAAGVAFGAIAGLIAIGAHSEAVSKCASYPDDCPSDGSGTRANQRAQTWATISTIAFVAGGALLAGGAVLYFTAPRSSAAVQLAPSVAAGRAGVVLDARF
ncbi:MAG TPA: hypothetical protein VIF62_21615 [Labilithrix sp.]|jgi:hypothetical protein